MKIEAGKKYVRRDGTISGVISDHGCDMFPYEDHLETYSTDGRVYCDSESKHDLISEYIEPPSQEAVEIKVLRAEVAELTAAIETLSKAFVVAQETLCDLVPLVLAIKHQLNVNDIVDEWDIDNSKERFKRQAQT